MDRGERRKGIAAKHFTLLPSSSLPPSRKLTFEWRDESQARAKEERERERVVVSFLVAGGQKNQSHFSFNLPILCAFSWPHSISGEKCHFRPAHSPSCLLFFFCTFGDFSSRSRSNCGGLAKETRDLLLRIPWGVGHLHNHEGYRGRNASLFLRSLPRARGDHPKQADDNNKITSLPQPDRLGCFSFFVLLGVFIICFFWRHKPSLFSKYATH